MNPGNASPDPAPRGSKNLKPKANLRPTGGGGDVEGEDFIPSRNTGSKPGGGRRTSSTPGPGWIVKMGVACALVVGSILWFNSPSTGDESKSGNWTHVEEANKESASSKEEKAKWVDKSGAGHIVSQIGLGVQDINQSLTTTVQTHLRNGDVNAAQSALVNSQQIPPIPPQIKDASGQAIQPVQPTLTPGQAADLRSGNAKLFQVFLYDSCAEDGDVVEVLINGVPFATVPIMHAGATLSVPVTSGAPTDVSIRGVYDGGGGITVACKTSQGEFFMRSMRAGEVCKIGVVQQ